MLARRELSTECHSAMWNKKARGSLVETAGLGVKTVAVSG